MIRSEFSPDFPGRAKGSVGNCTRRRYSARAVPHASLRPSRKIRAEFAPNQPCSPAHAQRRDCRCGVLSGDVALGLRGITRPRKVWVWLLRKRQHHRTALIDFATTSAHLDWKRHPDCSRSNLGCVARRRPRNNSDSHRTTLADWITGMGCTRSFYRLS